MVKEVARENIVDPHFQHYRFEMEVDADDRERLLGGGGEASSGVAFQIGKLRYIPRTRIYHIQPWDIPFDIPHFLQGGPPPS